MLMLLFVYLVVFVDYLCIYLSVIVCNTYEQVVPWRHARQELNMFSPATENAQVELDQSSTYSSPEPDPSPEPAQNPRNGPRRLHMAGLPTLHPKGGLPLLFTHAKKKKKKRPSLVAPLFQEMLQHLRVALPWGGGEVHLAVLGRRVGHLSHNQNLVHKW